MFAAARTAGAAFGEPIRLTRHGVWDADVAVAPGGAAVAAWNETGDGAIRAVFHDAGEPCGAALLVWARPNGAMRSATRPPGGPFDAPRDLPGGKGLLQALAVDAGGDAI